MNCPNCGAEIAEQQNFCETCGYDIRTIAHQAQLLERDPALMELDTRYAKRGLVRLIAGCAAAGSLLLLYQSLEGNLPDALGMLGMLLFLPSLLVFVIFCILRGTLRAKIRRELATRSAGTGNPLPQPPTGPWPPKGQ